MEKSIAGAIMEVAQVKNHSDGGCVAVAQCLKGAPRLTGGVNE